MRVSVVGDFNQWDGRTHPMRNRGPSGVWELFVPGLTEGAIYKYEIRPLSADLPLLEERSLRVPLGTAPEHRLHRGASGSPHWNDRGWMDYRARNDWFTSPISIYEVHLGSWRRVMEDGCRWLSYTELGDQLIPYVKWMGYTHVELMPVMEHPFDGVLGISDAWVFCGHQPLWHLRRLHGLLWIAFIRPGIGVFLDWTPGAFSERRPRAGRI